MSILQNRAIFMQNTNNLIWKTLPLPVAKCNEVLVKIKAVGICGSDIHYYQHGRIGDFIVQGDFILGHECAGEIVEVGCGVKNLSVGDRVALEPGKNCRNCEYCKEGRYNLCVDMEFFATPPYHGVFTDYVTYPEHMCFKLPDNVSNIEGALVEPLAVGLHAVEQGGVKLGDTVIIYGSGCIGLATLLASKAKGASEIIVVDVLENRLKIAKQLGATYVINSQEREVVSVVAEITSKRGAHVVLDAAGAKATVKQTVDVLKTGGTIVLIGMTPSDHVEFNFMKLMGKEGTLKTVFRYRNLYPIAIKSIANGTIKVKDIVSHEFDFENIREAFDFTVNNAKDVVKAVITMNN